jgi:hypothetical protein
VLQDVVIEGMSGSGIHVTGMDLEDPEAKINSNGWQFFNVSVANCDGHGVHLRGSDCNAGQWTGGYCGANGGPASEEDFSGPGFNLYDASFEGNTYVGVDFYTVGGQGCIFNSGVGGGTSFFGCYMEGSGGGYNITTSPVVLMGGGLADAPWMISGAATGSTIWNRGGALSLGTQGVAGLYAIIAGLSAGDWRHGVYYPVGIRRLNPNNGNVYEVKVAGESASSGAGPSGTGSDILDNTIHWAYVGPPTSSGSVQLGSQDLNVQSAIGITVPDDANGAGFTHYLRYIPQTGHAQFVLQNQYGISGASPLELDGNGLGRSIATNRTLMNRWPMKIPAGREFYQELWVGDSRWTCSGTATDPTYGTWNPGDRIYYNGSACVAGGREGRICVTGGTARDPSFLGGRTATADGSAVITLSGDKPLSLHDQWPVRVGDYVSIGGGPTWHVEAVSEADPRVVTLSGAVGAGSGLSVAYVPPVFKEFGSIAA